MKYCEILSLFTERVQQVRLNKARTNTEASGIKTWQCGRW